MLGRRRLSSSQIVEASSGEGQWYVLKNEKEYGPLHFSELTQFAKQRRLLKNDWIWKPGLDTWIAAGDLSDLFPGSSQVDDEAQQINRNDGERAKPKHDFKERARDQIKNFSVMFLYLWVVFGMLAIHESFVLSQHQIHYVAHGLAVINALVFAKVMLVAEDLRLGHRLNDKPLVFSILLKSLLFGIALICFHILEHVLIGIWHGEPIVESIADIGVNQLGGIVSVGIIATVALIPFFILREISRVIGGDNVWALFFHRRRNSSGV